MVVLCFAVLFFVFDGDTQVCFTYSLTCGNGQSKQNVLMTVRASSAYGTGKKKKT